MPTFLTPGIRAVLKRGRRLAAAYKFRKNLLTFLTYCERTKPGLVGSIEPEELEFLEELMRLSADHPGPIIEVGTLFGYTTQELAVWKTPEKELITIDDYSWNPVGLLPAAHRALVHRTLHYLMQRQNVRLFEGLSTEFHATYAGGAPSLVFIDASHEYEPVLADIQWARKQGAQVICGHDYAKNWPGVRRAVDESFPDGIKIRGSLWAWSVKAIS